PRDGRERVVAEVALRVLLAGQRRFNERLQPLGLLERCRLVAVGELWQHLASEELDRLHDVLVPVPAGLEHEDHLVDTGLLVPAEVSAPLVRRAYGTTQARRVAGRPLGPEPFLLHRTRHRLRIETLRGAALLVLGPHVGDAGTMLAEDVEV